MRFRVLSVFAIVPSKHWCLLFSQALVSTFSAPSPDSLFAEAAVYPGSICALHWTRVTWVYAEPSVSTFPLCLRPPLVLTPLTIYRHWSSQTVWRYRTEEVLRAAISLALPESCLQEFKENYWNAFHWFIINWRVVTEKLPSVCPGPGFMPRTGEPKRGHKYPGD